MALVALVQWSSSRATCTASSVWFGQELVQRRVDEPDRDRQAVHLAQDLGEVLALQRQQLGQRRLPAASSAARISRLDQLAPRAQEHVLGPAQPDPGGAEPTGAGGVLGGVGVRPHLHAAYAVGVVQHEGHRLHQVVRPRPCAVAFEVPQHQRVGRPGRRRGTPRRWCRRWTPRHPPGWCARKPGPRRAATSMSSCSAPHTQVRPMPRATTAACDVLPPRRSAPHAPRSCRAGRRGWSRGGPARRRRRRSPDRRPWPSERDRPEVAPGEAPTPVVRSSRGAVGSNRGNSSCASWPPVTRRTASSASISPSSTIARAIRNAASGVRLPTRVCRIHSRPLSMVNSMSHRSR